MKIIRTKEQADALKLSKEKANEGCDRCPCCGKAYYGFVVSKLYNTRWGDFLKTRHYKIDVYTCSSCGAIWKSEPYEC